jgi:hypothetical protein
MIISKLLSLHQLQLLFSTAIFPPEGAPNQAPRIVCTEVAAFAECVARAKLYFDLGPADALQATTSKWLPHPSFFSTGGNSC